MNPDRSMRDRSAQLDLIDWPDGICRALGAEQVGHGEHAVVP